MGPAIPVERLDDAVNVILSYQNPAIGSLPGGGSATYENTRSWPWMEILNPAETFGDIIIDYPYAECTTACLTALDAFRKKVSSGGGRHLALLQWGSNRPGHLVAR